MQNVERITLGFDEIKSYYSWISSMNFCLTLSITVPMEERSTPILMVDIKRRELELQKGAICESNQGFDAVRSTKKMRDLQDFQSYLFKSMIWELFF